MLLKQMEKGSFEENKALQRKDSLCNSTGMNLNSACVGFHLGETNEGCEKEARGLQAAPEPQGMYGALYDKVSMDNKHVVRDHETSLAPAHDGVRQRGIFASKR